MTPSPMHLTLKIITIPSIPSIGANHYLAQASLEEMTIPLIDFYNVNADSYLAYYFGNRDNVLKASGK